MMLDLFFALFNAFLLALVMGYVYRRFLQERVQHDMLLEHTMQLNMTKRQEMLRKQEQGLVRAYYHQHYRYEELSKKIELWRQALNVRSELRRNELEMLGEHVQKIRHERKQYMQNHVLCEVAMREAVAVMQRELTHLFGDVARADCYLERLLAVRDKQS